MSEGPICAICLTEIPVGSRNYMVLSDGTEVHKTCPNGTYTREEK